MRTPLALAAGGLALLACEDSADRPPVDTTYNPTLDPAEFAAAVDHPLFPLPPGQRWHYRGVDGEETDVVVEAEPKVILGISCTVVRDTVKVDGVVAEDTYDWFAQDRAGTVWYLGEDSTEYENGEADTAGSWESGVDGAKPGIQMRAEPRPGDKYRQEYLAGEAEDWGEVLAVGLSVTVEAGAYEGCVKIRDTNALEPGSEEEKFYCPQVGFVKAVDPSDGSTTEELVSVEPATP